MERRGILERFKRFSKPTGSPQWGQAVRALILMILTGFIAHLLGFDNGIKAIMFVTLLASIIIDISLPIRKVAVLALAGLFMTVLAFMSASLALTGIEIFLFFTVLWAFFSISMYIFGVMEGSLGFVFFLIYFVAVLVVNAKSSPFDWAIYSILSYLVVSLLFIPKIWLEKNRIREMVTVGFSPGSSIQNILVTNSILSGIPLNSNNYDIFKLGSYFRGLRTYSDIIISRLTSKSQSIFKGFLDASDELGRKIKDNFKSNKGTVDIKEFNGQLSTLKSHFLENEDSNEAVIELSHNIREILVKSNGILSRETVNGVNRIESPKKSLREVLDANFNLNNLYIRHAIRFTLAITIGLIFVYLTRERSAIWITMGILIILKPDITSTIDNLISRVGFNLFAIIIAIIISLIFPQGLLIWLAFIMLFLFRAFYPGYMGLSIIAMTVFVVLVWPTGTVFDNAIARLVDVGIGGIIAFICAYVILPSRLTVNLPEKLFNTIKANIHYADNVLINTSKEFNKDNASKCLKNYMMEENNMEAALKKLEDSYKDVKDDLGLYQEILASNNKLTADLTAAAALLSADKELLENFDILMIKNSLRELENFVSGDTEILKFSLETDNSRNDTNSDMEQLMSWIISDLQLIIKGTQIAAETGLLSRYRKLS
ncbi:MAG: FUSC family protein [Methanobacterium sp.]